MIKAESPNTAFNLIIEGKVDVVAGVRQALMANAAKLPGSRVFDERFMAIEQAMGMPHGRESGLRVLREFIEEVKGSGFVAQALERAGIRGVAVAPADGPKKGI
jgi:polar amino acid transport system substrate-binding protein